MNSRIIVTLLFLFLTTDFVLAQSKSPVEIYGNVRFAHIGSDTNADGLGGDNNAMRLRPGVKYNYSDKHSFSMRVAYLVSTELEPIKPTLFADGSGRLAFGSITFDEFFYRFKNENSELRIGRFQKSLNVLTNSKRSHIRYQSNSNNVHWTDGIYYKRNLNSGWFGEGILEYQPKDHPSFEYSFPLDFSKNDHNLTAYTGIENQERDSYNIIQKGIGLMYIPSIYLKPDGYADYLAISTRITFDFPRHDALRGGSIRVSGELGQNVNAALSDGTSMVASVGINNFAEKHEIMIEFVKTDSEWLTARNIYRPNADEMEIRYRFFFSSKWAFDARYRIRDSRTDGVVNTYSTFLRATYSF